MRVDHPVGKGWLTQTKDGKTRLYGTMRNYARRLIESLRARLVDDAPRWGGRAVQVRFSS